MRERKQPRLGKTENSIYGTASIKGQSKDEEGTGWESKRMEKN